MVGKIPRWEAKLWSYVSSGDGMHCPLYNCCQVRQGGGWCPDENKERLGQLLDGRRFNVNDYYFVETERARPCRVFQLTEALAQKYFRTGGLGSVPVPTVLTGLLGRRHAIEVRSLPLKAYHGAIWNVKDRWIIQLKESDTSAVKRFTLFHEAFHILAHYRTTPVFRKRGAIQGSFNELVADYFAVCVLIPIEWVKEKWAKVKDLRQMAEIFDVPKPAMCLRLRQLGLV